jgi:ABC-type branched-subunit amino acid transport system substrate-binding protein
MCLLRYCMLFTLACASLAAHARDILVGQVGIFTKDPQQIALQLKSGIELQFELVNLAGGILGRPIKLVTMDRGADVPGAVKATRELVARAKPVALIGLVGTGPTEALVREKALAEMAVPIVGVRTGAVSLHQRVEPWLFHTRANYGAEVERIVQSLTTIGYKRFAIFYERSVFGNEGLENAVRSLGQRHFSLVSKGTYEYNSADVASGVDSIARGQPDAVIAVGSSNAVAEFYKAFNAINVSAPVVALSTVDAATVAARIGPTAAYGLGITRVVPDPQNRRSPLVREFQDNGRRLRGNSFQGSQAELEGYIAAKVLVEGLRRTGADLTPAALRTSLEQIRRLDVGGLNIDFSPKSHSGSGFVDIGILGRNGRVLN